MNFVDYTLARLADDDLRQAILDQDALEQLLVAGYDTDALAFDGPFEPVFDRFLLGVSIRRKAHLEARWGEISDPQRNQLLLQLDSDALAPLRADVLWQGSIVAQVGGTNSRIERVSADWPDVSSIDAEIIADLGALPGPAAALEAERRRRLLERWRAAALQPDALPDAALDRWLKSIGAADVSDLITRWEGLFASATMQLGFSAPDLQPPTLHALPICAAMLIRDQPIDLAALLADSRQVREQLQLQGAERPPDLAAVGQTPVVVAWLVPGTVFDDTDWPGGDSTSTAPQNNANRKLVASRWLARQAIGLITPPPRAI